MFFGAFAIISFFVAIVAIYLGGKLLIKSGWIVGWVRGCVGLCLIFASAVMVLAALDVLSYKQLAVEKPVATVSFEKTNEQEFQAALVLVEEGVESEFQIFGDQWQIDARVIRWQGVFKIFGTQPVYRLDRLSGRYYSLEDERRKERSAHQLDASEYGFDMWHWLKENGQLLPWMQAVYGSATYLPMEDGAIYEVSLTSSGLAAKPLNKIAEGAISRWQ